MLSIFVKEQQIKIKEKSFVKKNVILMMILHSLTAVFTQRPHSSDFQRAVNSIAHIIKTNVNLQRQCNTFRRSCTSLLTLRSSVFLLSSSSFSWSLEVTVMLSVIRVTCSSADSSLSPAGSTSFVLHTYVHKETENLL